MNMVTPEQCGFLFEKVEEGLVNFNENDNPLYSMEPYPDDKNLSMQKFLKQCEWLYFSFFANEKTTPGEPEELALVWMYESLSHLMGKWDVWSNFTLLHEISFGLEDCFTQPPQISLGMMKQTDIDWLMPRPCDTPESKRFFAHGIHYTRERSEFGQCFGSHFDQKSDFWIYTTRFPFWKSVPKFYSGKNSRYRKMRVYDWDITLSKIWGVIVCYEQLWVGTNSPITNEFLMKLGLRYLSFWNPTNWSMPKNGQLWTQVCGNNDLQL